MTTPLSARQSGKSSLKRKPMPEYMRRIIALLLVICFVFAMPAQHVQAVVSTKEISGAEKNRLTAYVSSALAQRHGLCVLLENVDSAGNKKYGLIDTGNPNPSAAKAFLNKHGVRTLEFMILTHMHKDHIGNAAWIMKHYRVRKLYLKQFDSTWSNGDQAGYENILRTALTSPFTTQIYGVGYGLSLNKIASPRASKSFISFLQSHAKVKHRFKGLFTPSNTAMYLGQTSVRIFNWEVWAENGTAKWLGKGLRCKAQKYTIDSNDNHFSLGVRATRGTQKIWIGGDMTNLRLVNMRRTPYKGDEERLAGQIGKVDVAILNHHGRGGSNCNAFLSALHPSYVVYTNHRSEILSGAGTKARAAYDYIRNSLRIPQERILWAYDYWGTHRDDVVVTLYPKGSPYAPKEDPVKTTPASTAKKASAEKALVTSFLPGKTYTNYDLTGDGKKDIVTVSSTKAGGAYKGLTISINKKAVWSTKVSFKDAKPVTLVRLPGKQPYLCISVLTLAGGSTGKVFGLYQYAQKGTKQMLVERYSLLKNMPVNGFSYTAAPTITCTAKRITIVTSGSDKISKNAIIRFALELGKNGLKNVDSVFPYTTGSGKAVTITLKQKTDLYAFAKNVNRTATIAKGKKVTVNGVVKNAKGITRYRIITPDKKVWWINIPAARQY